jgi:formate dehydrogenase subunit gamma
MMKKAAALTDIPIRIERVSALTPAQRSTILDVCGNLKSQAGPLLPILHGVQSALGYVPEDAVPLLAAELNITRAEVHGVLTFYHYFRTEPCGRHVLYLCRAEACQSVGAGSLERHAKQALGIGFHETTPDGSVTLEPVYCLGNCALGPSILMDNQLLGRVTPERFDELLAEARAPS